MSDEISCLRRSDLKAMKAGNLEISRTTLTRPQLVRTAPRLTEAQHRKNAPCSFRKDLAIATLCNPAAIAESNQQIDAVVPFTALAELHNSGSTALRNDRKVLDLGNIFGNFGLRHC